MFNYKFVVEQTIKHAKKAALLNRHETNTRKKYEKKVGAKKKCGEKNTEIITNQSFIIFQFITPLSYRQPKTAKQQKSISQASKCNRNSSQSQHELKQIFIRLIEFLLDIFWLLRYRLDCTAKCDESFGKNSCGLKIQWKESFSQSIKRSKHIELIDFKILISILKSDHFPHKTIFRATILRHLVKFPRNSSAPAP